MIRHPGYACLAISLGLSVACNERPSIEAETRDLAEARNDTANVVQDLEKRLETAKAEVVELEQKLALAREGITDEVLKERAELENALNAQRQEVQKDVNEARRESEVLNKNRDQALQLLRETQPPAHFDTRVETEVTKGTPPQNEGPPREEIVPVRGGPEEQPSREPGDDESTTTTTPPAPIAPENTAVPENAPVPPVPIAPPPSDDAPAQ